MSSYAEHLETFVTRLQEESLDYKKTHSIFSELCDTLETYNGSQEYDQFLKKLLPIFFKQLEEIPISFSSSSPEQKLRALILDILHRLPTNENLQPHATLILDVLVKLIRSENEENGRQCMKIITSLHKSYKAVLANKVQEFIDLIQEIYQNIHQVVEEQFGSQSNNSQASPLSSSSAEFGADDNTSKHLFKATHSFKMIAECPITMVSLYSSYKELIDPSIHKFIPQVIDLLKLQAAKQKEAHETAHANNKYVTTVSPEIKNRVMYGDFILGQVKAASFLAYVFIRRSSSKSLEPSLQPYYNDIPDLIIRLLQDCPSELAAARRELLHATRHILSTDFRTAFLPKIDLLFDDRVIIGEGLTAHETLRPLAYSIVADFIHVNGNLTPQQIWKSVEIYCQHLQDSSLAQTVHIMSAKLLLNLVDRILRLENKTEARQLFLIMIDAFVKRFILLNRQYDDILQQHDIFMESKESKKAKKEEWQKESETLTGKALESAEDPKSEFQTLGETSNGDGTEKMDIDKKVEEEEEKAPVVYTMSDIQRDLSITITQSTPQDPLENARYLFRTLMTFLKSVFYGFRNCNPPPPKGYAPQAWNGCARIASEEELNILKQLFRECISGLKFFQSSKPATINSALRQTFDASGPNLPITSSKEEKDLMEIFATMFIYVEPAAFNEIVQSELENMFEAMLKNAALLHIPQFFLASEITTSNFSGILIIFVMSKLHELGEMDIIKSNILIRLFKLCFMSVNLFPTANESVILPHLNKMILNSLEFTTTAKEPIVYFYLIRTLFRSIGGGRFEALYKEILPLLQVLLESLNRLIQTARRPQERDIYVELCLTVPVRLSVLVPHLSYLMRPLVFALNGSQELISQGLRTLELCVDNLTAEYFDPIVEPVIEDVMKALWKHLRPLPYYHQHSHTTFRILGKLGGRNRSFIGLHQDLQPETATNQDIEALFKIEGLPGETPVSMTAGVSTALNTLVNGRYKLHYRISAFKYLSSVLKLFINTDDIPEDLPQKVALVVEYIGNEEKQKAAVESIHLQIDEIEDVPKFNRQEELLIKLLEALFYSVSIDEVREEAENLIRGICQHYVLLYFGRTVVNAYKFNRQFSVNNHEGKNSLNENTIFDAISYALSFHVKAVREVGIESIKTIFNACVTLFGSVDDAIKFLPIRRMCSKFVHCCFEEAYYSKLGGCLGLQTMVNDIGMPVSYFTLRQLEILRAMFFVLRDTPADVPAEVCNVAKSLVLKLLEDCNKEVSKEAVFQHPFQSVVSQIVFDLSNSNPNVRETAHKALSVLSNVTQVPIATMISPSKGILLAPIFGKPLRALPFHMQIGNIDAITFCLGLENTFLEFNDELNRLLSESLALVDAEDESLISVHRISEHRTSEQLVKLRVVCIELLSLALTKPAFSNGNPQIRIRILGVFFKTLSAKSSKIINAAHAGLKQVLSQNSKLPKELLQSGLRPMLMNLSDHKKLTVSGLEALSRLLELLISYFKVEIGRKLLDHLMAWAQPQALQRIALQELDNNPTVQIIVAILNIFHLLPSQAYTFMEELLSTLLYLETNLRRYQKSPFRASIAKFLDRFGEHSANYFKQKISSRIYGSRFAYFAALPDSRNLRENIITQLSSFTQSLVQETNSELKYIKFANMVDLVAAIGSQDSEWLKEQGSVLRQLFDVSSDCLQHKKTAALVSPIHFQMDQSIAKLQSIFVDYMKLNGSPPDDLINLIDYVCLKDLSVSGNVSEFIFSEIISSTDATFRQSYLKDIVEKSSTDALCLKSKVYLMKYVFIPICLYEVHMNGDLSALASYKDESLNWVVSVNEKIWKTASDSSAVRITGAIDTYRLELLHLTAMLVKVAPDVIANYRKEIIKFNWNLITLDDLITKQAAYVSTAYFIASFDTPSKLVTQIFVALLKANQLDIRYQVRQALDILAPVLEKRVGSTMEWLKWPRRVLSEDGFNVTQVLNVYQFIVYHSDLFYVARDHFIPNIITAMGKLTILNNSSAENQILAIDMADLILKWETRSKQEAIKSRESNHELAKNDGMDIDQEGSKTRSLEAYTVPFGQRETCITFLIRYVCICQHRASENELGQRALNILHILLSPSYWPEVTVKLAFFERFLITADFSTSNVLGYCLNALEVLGVALEWKTSGWIVSNIAYLQKLLEKCIRSDNHDIQEVLQKVLRIILKAIKLEVPPLEEDQPEDVKNFLAFLVTAVSEDLNSMNSVAAGITLSWTLAQYKPDTLNPLIPLVMRTLSKLVKDHIAIASQNRQYGSNSDSGAYMSDYEAKMTTKLLEKILNFSSMRISALGDQRRIFLSLLVQLIDRSVDKDLLMKIVHIARGWVFAKNELFPTTKEKAGILSKMMVFEMKGDAGLAKAFYQIIVDIFKDESLTCSELTVRMEHPFLVGTKLSEVTIRQELMAIMDKSLEKDLSKRLFYVIREQNWEYLAEYPWLNQAAQILYGSFDSEYDVRLDSKEHQLAALGDISEALPADLSTEEGAAKNEAVEAFVVRHLDFIKTSLKVKTKDIITPLLDISYQSPETIHRSWCNLFPIAYNSIDNRDKSDFLHSFVTLLSKDYHVRQQDGKPNVIHTMLEAAGKCEDLQLPPHLVKYLGLNYDAWYSGVRILEQIESNPITENSKIHETNRDALVEMYSSLQEDDMFYGLWRRRAKYFETNSALSYEQIGLWDKGIQLYENAQIKARSGVLPYSESEYALWEDNWILCAEKLQHWDILTELAKHEGFTDLLLECGWRVADWISDREPLEQSVKTVMEVPTPRRQMFQTFLCLQGYAHNKETIQNVTRYCDEGIQLALRKWHSLPQRITNSHVALLHTFQQYVEFMEASQVYRSLATTTAQNLDVKSQELKRVLQAWRERLPNIWDDINIWNDLVTWRQHAFNVINKVYMPLIPALQQNHTNNNSYAFRGYHEIAWVINRFAHVARKHNMSEVCINQLTKIYTLPNIEIQEAFLKLREQAKCHYQNPAELNTGLDVISNTNLVYFAAQQKAEFITLKGMFLAKLNAPDEANQAFATAVQLDLNLPKAWAEWGFFNDNRFKESNDIAYAKHAISCYLQAAGLYKNSKARRLLCRIIWLISLDDSNGTLADTFESHQGEMPVWHWVTFIPQLLTSLSHREARLARQVLIRIAKAYPQALHFQLRTTKEDYAVLQRQMTQQNSQQRSNSSNGSSTPVSGTAPGTATGASVPPTPNLPNASPAGGNSSSQRQPWQHVEEIMGILKTAYPLLALSLESLVDQIGQRFKSNNDGDAYRLVVALYNDGIQYFNRLANPREDARLPPATEANIIRFADTVLPKHIRQEFEVDIIQSKPNLETYISKLRKWRDCLEEKLDRSFGKVNMERVCPHLSQFHHQKFEDIEVPGQYLLNKENNNHFIKIERFMPILELIRGPTACYKRMTIRGHDGSIHPFAVQFPAARHCRREERIFQLFRIFNDALSKNVQARRRNIELTLPIAIPLSPHIRVMSDDEKYVNMLSIYEDFCKKKGQNRDVPLAYTIEKLHAAYDPRLPKPDLLSVKTEILAAIQSMFVPSTVMKDHFISHYQRFEDFWLFRKQFSSQYAAFIFMTYMLCINARQPQKIHINQGSGKIWTSEMLPYKVASGKTHSTAFATSSLDVSAQRAAPLFCSLELVPFRLTPNVQKLIGEAGLEGILSMHIMIIAQCLADPEYEIEHYLSLFVRDEMIAWFTQQHRPSAQDPHLREIVRVNVDFVIKRVMQLAHMDTNSQGVASQFILNLIAHAVNPRNLASTDTLWMAYF
ncbi:hypothetical protein CANARDRAFT_26566 [[Candida] arabinofermentans NRRL YB-2248]|uniref:Non-specific serine/threonine protein kinase n=1 Tax=[Candida] arabinofermentans NRRL YB-2248 TaxID=983967 RepID=A0A1E4T5Z1_9ASCO|nr:hypothetical protein CANARDRAFT_26566 [[Candida] arabinofermentans NRRL YB-2248]